MPRVAANLRHELARLASQHASAVQRQPRVGGIAHIGFHQVESILAARDLNRFSRLAVSITTLVISLTTPAPRRRVNLRTVDSSGTRSPSAIRQNLRRWIESDTSRTSVSYPQPVRCLITINRTYVAIEIVGRP
jgi:hypothetical protein